MRLGEHFTLEELTLTQTGKDNTPNTGEMINLTRLVSLLLDPLRAIAGELIVTSGFRSQAVNKAVGGVATSYHTKGLAADIICFDKSPEQLAWLVQNFDKVIAENLNGNMWLHCQLAPAGTQNRRIRLKAEEINGKTVYSELKS